MTCPCERCQPDNPAQTYTKAHLITCLAREIAALPSLTERRARIVAWEKRHGAGWGDALKGAVRQAFTQREASRVPTDHY